jgi:RNA polymerase sigma-70 factor (ECF subfamily)
MSRRAGTPDGCCSRDEARFGELYGRYYRPVRDYCRRRVAADAVDDVVAEVFLTAWRRLADVPDARGALLWLYGVAFRAIGHHWRSTSRRRRLEVRMLSVADHPASAADELVLDGDECRLVLDAIVRLGATDAEVLLLVAWEHLSVVDIATVLGIAPNAVAQRLHRARSNLGREYRRLQSRPMPTPIASKGRDR